jgi:hypothetical protein
MAAIDEVFLFIFVGRHLPEAKASRRKVLEIDLPNSLALGFIGITHHLLEETDEAIVKCHDVCTKFIREQAQTLNATYF